MGFKRIDRPPLLAQLLEEEERLGTALLGWFAAEWFAAWDYSVSLKLYVPG
jgi:hypothetical protein